MGLLTAAIKSELNTDYSLAIRYYRKLASQGSLLDRVGIYQALARCREKLGDLKRAGAWHEKAGDAYLRISNRTMGEPERAYYALLEFRSALQDYGSGKEMQRAAARYLTALTTCLKHGKEGYSHEMLFAGFLSANLGSHKRAGRFLMDSAEQFKQGRDTELAREIYTIASKHFRRAGIRRDAVKAHAMVVRLR